MGVGLEVDFSGRTEQRERLLASNARWTNAAVDGSCSVLAREQPPDVEVATARDGVERLARGFEELKAYLIGRTVVFSAVEPLVSESETITLLETRLKSPETPVVSYHFHLPASADVIVSRYILEHIKKTIAAR